MRAALVLWLVLPLAAWAQARDFDAAFDDGDRWAEAQSQLPPYPEPENYLPFKVNAVTPFGFFVDAKSVSVDNDGVVRYTVIAKSASGALNISFEGIRCSGHQYRVYAFGRSDHTWAKARSSHWQPLSEDAANAQRAILYGDFFCPGDLIISTAETGLRALRRGGQERARDSDQ